MIPAIIKMIIETNDEAPQDFSSSSLEIKRINVISEKGISQTRHTGFGEQLGTCP